MLSQRSTVEQESGCLSHPHGQNSGRWVHHFIKNIEKIVQETKDEHLHVVIYDFDSPDIDLKQAFQRSTLKNFHYIRNPGKYSRTVSSSEAIKSIMDPNAIVVTTDLHLDIGSKTINDVRKVRPFLNPLGRTSTGKCMRSSVVCLSARQSVHLQIHTLCTAQSLFLPLAF